MEKRGNAKCKVKRLLAALPVLEAHLGPVSVSAFAEAGDNDAAVVSGLNVQLPAKVDQCTP